MEIPAEAVNAIRLLWGYYLSHIVFIIALIWPFYAFGPLKRAIQWNAIMLGVVAIVELFQAMYPVLGDGDWNDLWIGAATVFICFVLFTPIKLQMRIIREK